MRPVSTPNTRYTLQIRRGGGIYFRLVVGCPPKLLCAPHVAHAHIILWALSFESFPPLPWPHIKLWTWSFYRLFPTTSSHMQFHLRLALTAL